MTQELEEKEQYWTRFANDFEERNNYVVGKKSMRIALEEVGKHKNLGKTLELACGNGTYSKVLYKNAESLICTDFSEEMVIASRQRLKDLKNVTVEQANCFDLPYDDNTFDTIFMANLLHIIPNPEKALIEAKRVLKEDGRIIALDVTNTGTKLIHKIPLIIRYLKTYGKPPMTGQNVDHKVMKKLMETAGLKVDSVKLIGSKINIALGVARR